METIGPALFAEGPGQKYLSSIATLFPRHELLITSPPLHALQRAQFSDWFEEKLAAKGSPAATTRKLAWETGESVDLILAIGGLVLIRPEIERLDLAFWADEMLQAQWKVPKHRIRFVGIQDPRIRQALRKRGELWRTNSVIENSERLAAPVEMLQVALEVLPIYYYNPHTGTRYLTFKDFQGLAEQAPAMLARQLNEIAEHAVKRNRHGHAEIAFFGADPLQFGAPNFVQARFDESDPERLHERHRDLVQRFEQATPETLRGLNLGTRSELRELLAVLSATGPERDPVTTPWDRTQQSDPPMSVRWLPGGCFTNGEFIFETIFPNDSAPHSDPELAPLWDPLARGFIANFIREYSNIEHLNLGRVEIPASIVSSASGRRGVYLAEIKVRDEIQTRKLLLRVQRWGIAERLEERNEDGSYKKNLVGAILDTEEYVDYTLDRRLGCLQFGMRLPARVNMRRVSEVYRGHRAEYWNHRFPVIYYERDYLYGIPSNRIPERKLNDPRYALALARILGAAAAPNMLVGRVVESTIPLPHRKPIFDDGDEIIIEGSDGLPVDHALVDHSAAFTDWRDPSLLPVARGYAEPVNRRSAQVQDPGTFANVYLDALAEELLRLQSDYKLRHSAFDGLFKHLNYDPEGSFAYRWESILKRLLECDVPTLRETIRRHITVLT